MSPAIPARLRTRILSILSPHRAWPWPTLDVTPSKEGNACDFAATARRPSHRRIGGLEHNSHPPAHSRQLHGGSHATAGHDAGHVVSERTDINAGTTNSRRAVGGWPRAAGGGHWIRDTISRRLPGGVPCLRATTGANSDRCVRPVGVASKESHQRKTGQHASHGHSSIFGLFRDEKKPSVLRTESGCHSREFPIHKSRSDFRTIPKWSVLLNHRLESKPAPSIVGRAFMIFWTALNDIMVSFDRTLSAQARL